MLTSGRSLRVAVILTTMVLAAVAITGRSGAEPAGTVAPSFALGYAQTMGDTGVPWFRGAAQLNQPWGVTADGDAVWIADSAGRRLLKFASAGRYLDEIGRAGLSHGIHEHPVRFIADVTVSTAFPPGVDPDDPDAKQVETVWLVDSAAHYVLALTRATGATLVLGEPDVAGDDDAHLSAPSSVATDGAGNAYVSDTGNHRVLVFDPDAKLIASIGSSGAAGSGDDQLDSPGRLVIGHDNHLYVADTGNHRVQSYDVSDPAAPALVKTFGRTGQAGSGPLELDRPLGVATDATFLYVADSGNCRVQVLYRTRDAVFDSVGSPGGCTGSDAIRLPSDVAVDEGGHVYVADPGSMRVHQLKPEDRSFLHRFGTSGVPYVTDGGHYNEPAGLATGDAGALYVVERAGHRLIRRADDGSVAWIVGQAGIAGDDDAHLDHPADVAADGAGRAYVADSGNHRVQVFGVDGTLAATVGGRGTADGEFECPTGVAVAGDGRLAVADACLHRVQLFDAAGGYLSTVGTGGQGSGHGDFDEPSDAAFDAGGRLFVADTGNQRIEVFDGQLQHATTLGVTGDAGDDFAHFHSPSRLATDADGRLFVADTGNHRVQVFGADGTYLTTLGGRTGTRTGEMREPLGVALGGGNRVFVADSGNHRVQAFDPAKEPWTASNVNGFAHPDREGIVSLADFDGALFAGVYAPESGASVWRRDRDTGAWAEVASGGFGDVDNESIPVLTTHDGQLYAGTNNLRTTVDPASGAITRASAGAAMYRSADGTGWDPVVEGGFGTSDNAGITAMHPFGTALYAGTASLTETHGAEVWRSDTGDAGTWSLAIGGGFDGDLGNTAVSAMATFTGSLYAATCHRTAAGELWRTDNGVNWVPAGANGQAALGSRNNRCVSAMTVFDGWLYAATGGDARVGLGSSAVEVWRCQACDGSDWESASPPGLGDTGNRGGVAFHVFDEPPFRFLYVAVGNADGLGVLRTSDGDEWEQVAYGGFGDSNNANIPGPLALEAHDGRLFLGTLNTAHGGEVWSTAGARPGIGVPTPPGPVATPTPRPRPQPPSGRAAYQLEDQWPPSQVIGPDIIGEVLDMAIADDGTVFLLDRSNNRVMRLRPDGTWGEAFGNTGRGPERIGQVGSLAVDVARDRVYVADHASERLLSYTVDGQFVDAWPAIYASGIEVQPGGDLWIADRTVGAVRHLDTSGNELGRFGGYGDRIEDQFRGLQDVTLDPDGNLFVSDLDGDRIRGFRPELGSFVRFRTIDIANRANFRGCSGARIAALGVERLLAGQCIIDGSQRDDVFPGNHTGSDLYGTQLHTANVGAGLYYALATYDSDTSDPENETYPVVVRFFDEGFDIVERHWQGRWLDRRNAAADGAINGPLRISTAPDGTLMLTDDYGLRRRGADGGIITELPIVPYPSRRNPMRFLPDMAVGEGRDGRVMGVAERRVGRGSRWTAVYAGTEVRRYCRAGRCEVNPYLDVIWETVLPQMTEGVAAVAHEPTENQFVVLTRYHTAPFTRGVEAIEYQLLIYPLDGYGLKKIVALPGDDREVIWADVETGPSGRIYVLDTLNDRVQVLDPDGNDLGMVPTPKDAWRIAGGPNDEMYFLTVYGHVVRTAADGTVLSRFVARPHEGVPPTSLVDIAVDPDGWVYAVDGLANQVSVFGPEGSEDEILIGDTCTVSGDKWVDPRDVLLGDTTTLYLRLFGSCGFVEKDADIVLAINTKGRTLADDPGRQLANTLRSARQVAALTDLDRHRLGVVAYAVDSAIEAELTNNSYQIALGLRDARADRGDPSRTYAGLKEASDLFDAESADRQRVIILFEANDDETDQASLDLAEALKAEGVLILVVNDTSAVATGDLYDDIEVDPRAMGAGKAAHRRMVERHRPDVIIRSGTLTDRLPQNMAYVPGSAQPPATWDPASRTLTWTLTDLSLHTSHEFSLEIEPQEEGEWPTNAEAASDYVDGWQHPGRLVLPVPRVRVYGELPPTATPTPTATNTPEPTPTPGPTAVPMPLYLPVALHVKCTPKDRNADVALIIDTSGSMSQATSPGGPTKLEAAKEAARTFLGQLVPQRDQAALIQFNNAATVVVPLTDDPALVIAGLDALTQDTGTRIDLALDTGLVVLTGPDRRPDNNPVLILLTDGEPTGTTPEDVVAAADRVREAGVLAYTIGLGDNVDHELLRRVATVPEWYFHAPDTSDLEDIYRQIAGSIPCVPKWP